MDWKDLGITISDRRLVGCEGRGGQRGGARGEQRHTYININKKLRCIIHQCLVKNKKMVKKWSLHQYHFMIPPKQRGFSSPCASHARPWLVGECPTTHRHGDSVSGHSFWSQPVCQLGRFHLGWSANTLRSSSTLHHSSPFHTSKSGSGRLPPCPQHTLNAGGIRL